MASSTARNLKMNDRTMIKKVVFLESECLAVKDIMVACLSIFWVSQGSVLLTYNGKEYVRIT